MLFQPWQYVCNIKDRSVGRANRMTEGLQRYSAKIERQPFKRGFGCISLCDARASARRVSIFGSPLAMSDLWVMVSATEPKL